MEVVAERFVPLRYRDKYLECGLRLDLLVEVILPVHQAQLLSYLRLTNKPLGLLINFNVSVLVKGVRRVMNGAPI